jgi:hypothetical protein
MKPLDFHPDAAEEVRREALRASPGSPASFSVAAERRPIVAQGAAGLCEQALGSRHHSL